MQVENKIPVNQHFSSKKMHRRRILVRATAFFFLCPPRGDHQLTEISPRRCTSIYVNLSTLNVRVCVKIPHEITEKNTRIHGFSRERTSLVVTGQMGVEERGRKKEMHFLARGTRNNSNITFYRYMPRIFPRSYTSLP